MGGKLGRCYCVRLSIWIYWISQVKQLTIWQIVVFKKITAFILLDCYWKSQMMLMQFRMLNMKSLLEASTNVAFTATDLLLRYRLSEFCLCLMLKHCNAHRNTPRKCQSWYLRWYICICKYSVHKLRTVSLSIDIFFMANFNENLSLYNKKILMPAAVLNRLSSFSDEENCWWKCWKMLTFGQIVTFPSVCYVVELAYLK